jgi:hypothetical protein
MKKQQRLRVSIAHLLIVYVRRHPARVVFLGGLAMWTAYSLHDHATAMLLIAMLADAK